MAMPTIEELRHQCRIDAEDDEQLLLMYANAAKKRAENYINRILYDDVVPIEDETGLSISDDIKLAIMLAVGFWYENREPQALPAGFFYLIDPYRFIPL